MIEESNKPEAQWRVIKESVRGASHVRTGLPNQDRALALPETGENARALLAIADGHGSAKYFRSHLGAEFAIDAAVTVLEPLMQQKLERTGLSAIKRWATEQLPQKLVKVWRESVKSDLEQKRFSPTQVFSTQELTMLRENEDAGALKVVEADPFIAYGSTILAALVTEFFIIYVQLGDGDILAVSDSEKGEVTRPIAADQRLMANETTSLCSRNAWNDFRVSFQVLPEAKAAPALILISTDGYANSFRDESEFTRVGSDLLQLIRFDSLDEVKGQLIGWLDDASKQGSGDDISLGILSRTQAIRQTIRVSQKENVPFSTPTLAEAIKKARPGALIFLEPGIYQSACNISKPLSIRGRGSSGEIILESTDQPCLTIQMDGVHLRDLVLRSQHSATEPGKYATLDISADRVVLEQCDVSSGTSASIALHGDAINALIQECHIHHSAGSGIKISGGSRAVVRYCSISENAEAGVSIERDSNSTIQNCKIYHGTKSGIMVDQKGKGYIEDCDIYENGYTGIEIKPEGEIFVKACRINRNAHTAIKVYPKALGSVEKCELSANHDGAWDDESLPWGRKVRRSGNKE